MKQALSPLTLYGVVPITGLENFNTLSNAKAASLKYLEELARKDATLGQNVHWPPTWKQYLTPWVVDNTRASDLLKRLDYLSPVALFDKLLERIKIESSMFSSDFRDLVVKLSKPQSMDVHNVEIHEYTASLFDKKMKEVLEAKVTYQLDYGNLLNGDYFNGGEGVEIKRQILLKSTQDIQSIVEDSKSILIEAFKCNVMMGIVAADPILFSSLEKNQVANDAKSSDLTDWIQERILDNKQAKISLKCQEGVISPLTFIKNLASNVVPPINYNNNNRQSQQQQQQAAPQGAGQVGNPAVSTKQKRTGPIGANPGPAQKKPKVEKKLGQFRCNYCFANYPNTTAKTFHDDLHCKRDPKSPKYDSVFAASKPKN
jgi:hypothetical protein